MHRVLEDSDLRRRAIDEINCNSENFPPALVNLCKQYHSKLYQESKIDILTQERRCEFVRQEFEAKRQTNGDTKTSFSGTDNEVGSFSEDMKRECLKIADRHWKEVIESLCVLTMAIQEISRQVICFKIQ